LRWWLSPDGFKVAIAATIPKVALEFTIPLDASTTLQDYARIKAATLIIAGSKTRAPARAVVDLLAGALPHAKLVTLKGAGHMSPFTHPAELNRVILSFLAAHK
jgi:pimeloyl-ACP methyl ester carboxylesterase